MNKIFSLVKKNLKLLLRTRSSSLIVVLGPLLIILLVGLAFDNANTYSLNIGTYSDEYSDLSNSYINLLKQKDFNVKQINSKQECIDQIKTGSLHTCLIFPNNLSISNDEVQTIELHIDYSRVNIAYNILEVINSKISTGSNEISLNLTSQLIEAIEYTKTKLNQKDAVVVQLKSENELSKKDLEEINSKLNSIDLSMDPNSFKISELKTSIDTNKNSFNSNSNITTNLKTNIVSLKSLTDSKVNNSRTLITQIKSSLASINVSSVTINSRLDSIDSSLLNISAAVSNLNSTNLSLNDWKDVSVHLTNIEQNINSVKNKISNADNTRNEIKNKLNSTLALVANMQNEISDVKLSFDLISEKLDDIKVTNAENIVLPVKTEIRPVSSQNNNLNYLFPSLLALVVMFVSIMFAATFILMEKHSQAYFRNFITPTSDFIFIFGAFLTSLIVVSLQWIILLGLGIYFLSTSIVASSFLNLIFALFVVSTTFISIGLVIGFLFNSEETSILASLCVGSTFLFMSNLILPIESMPASIVSIAQFNPFVLAESILRKTIIFSQPLSTMLFEYSILIIYFTVFLVFAYLLQKMITRHLIQKVEFLSHKIFSGTFNKPVPSVCPMPEKSTKPNIVYPKNVK